MKVKFGEKCIGCNVCAKVCPEVFGFDKEKRRAFLKVEEVPAAQERAVRDAALMCLVGNLKIEG